MGHAVRFTLYGELCQHLETLDRFSEITHIFKKNYIFFITNCVFGARATTYCEMSCNILKSLQFPRFYNKPRSLNIASLDFVIYRFFMKLIQTAWKQTKPVRSISPLSYEKI